MAYGAISKVSFSSVELSPDETNRQALTEAVQAASNDATKCAFGTSTTARYFRCIPLNGTGTDMVAAVPPFAFANVGWKIDPDDMGATAGLKRVILAGDWTITSFLVSSAVVIPVARLAVEVWRVASGGATATRIFTAESADAAPLVTLGSVFTLTKTGVSEVVFEAGETLMIEVYIRSAGVAITGNTITMRLAVTDTNNIVDWPENLRDRTPVALSATCTPVAAFGPKKIGKRRFATVTAAATMARHLTLHRTFAAAVTAVGTMARRLTLRRTFAASVTTVATMLKRVRLPRIASVTAAATWQKKVGKRQFATVTAVATMRKKVAKRLYASATAFATMARALRLSRRMNASVTAVAKARAQLAFEDVPGDGTGGGTTIIGVSRSRILGGV